MMHERSQEIPRERLVASTALRRVHCVTIEDAENNPKGGAESLVSCRRNFEQVGSLQRRRERADERQRRAGARREGRELLAHVRDVHTSRAGTQRTLHSDTIHELHRIRSGQEQRLGARIVRRIFTTQEHADVTQDGPHEGCRRGGPDRESRKRLREQRSTLG